MRFKVLEDGGSDTWKWISDKPMTDGDWPTWFVMEIIDMDAACGRDGNRYEQYAGQISAVAPDAVPEEGKAAARESCGWGDPNALLPDEMWAQILQEYGIAACIYQARDNSRHKLERRLRKEMKLISMFFGFYMDKPLNQIGSTGWDFISGDINRPLREYRDANGKNITMDIMRKMHGMEGGNDETVGNKQ